MRPQPPTPKWTSRGGSLIFSFGISPFPYQKEGTTWCSHNLCGNSAVPTRIVGTENWFPIGCSDKFVGTTVPTKIVGTPNGGFLLAVPTNLSEETNIYNSAPRTPVRSCLTCWISAGRDSVMELSPAHHINEQTNGVLYWLPCLTQLVVLLLRLWLGCNKKFWRNLFCD